MRPHLKLPTAVAGAVLVGLGLLFRLHGHLPGEMHLAALLANTTPRGTGTVALALTDPPRFFAAVVVLGVLASRIAPRDGLLLGLGLGLAAVCNDVVLKHLVGRTKDLGLAFPSGHATAGALIGAGLTLLAAWTWPRRRIWLPTLLLAASYVLFVDWWLLSTRSHYPADVLGSLCVAALTAGLLDTLRNKLSTSIDHQH